MTARENGAFFREEEKNLQTAIDQIGEKKYNKL